MKSERLEIHVSKGGQKHETPIFLAHTITSVHYLEVTTRTPSNEILALWGTPASLGKPASTSPFWAQGQQQRGNAVPSFIRSTGSN